MQGDQAIYGVEEASLGTVMGKWIPGNQAKSVVLVGKSLIWAFDDRSHPSRRTDLPRATLDLFERGQPPLCLSFNEPKLLNELQEELAHVDPSLDYRCRIALQNGTFHLVITEPTDLPASYLQAQLTEQKLI